MTPEGISVRHPDQLYIGGRWVAPSSDASFELVCPNSESVVGRVAAASSTDMDRAVAAAREAFDNGPWPRLSPAERGTYLRRFADELAGREPELAAA